MPPAATGDLLLFCREHLSVRHQKRFDPVVMTLLQGPGQLGDGGWRRTACGVCPEWGERPRILVLGLHLQRIDLEGLLSASNGCSMQNKSNWPVERDKPGRFEA